MRALLDTGFLLALLADDDPMHDICLIALSEVTTPLVPSAVLPELAYMTIRNIGYSAYITFVRAVLAGQPPLVFPLAADLARATDIIEQYVDSRIDWVDCTIAAMAERLEITRILTLDQRHFRILRPVHSAAFEVLP